ncbi:hypothetical protein [Campylobacter upsaliensis]|uniref:hypothetical protein n=1 Tax=Campylobacter upsaliensis TaxID=28080 RepID=UPI0022EA2B37|nr:hypothetical protein [Campylobacter upsaliensis]
MMIIYIILKVVFQPFGPILVGGLVFDTLNYEKLCEGSKNALFLKYRSCAGGGGGLSFL